MLVRCGFIGLGQMGGRMARHLQRAGHELVVYDPVLSSSAAVLSSSHDKKTAVAASPAEVVTQLANTGDGTGVVFTMLPDPAAVQRVYLTPDVGLLTCGAAGPALSFVDCSTIDPATAQRVSAAAAAIGSAFADAPVGGAGPGAEAGSLTFMVGCDGGPAALVKADGPFDAMGSRVVHCGGAGSGQAAKLCNNMVLATTMVSVSEGMLLGQRLGLEAATLAEIFNTSSAHCWASHVYNPCPGVVEGAPSSRDFEGGWPTAGMQKDMRLALQAARAVDSATPLAGAALGLYDASAEAGYRNKDFSSIYAFLGRVTRDE